MRRKIFDGKSDSTFYNIWTFSYVLFVGMFTTFFYLSEVLNLSIEYCYCQTFSALVVATMCLAGHQDLSCSNFPIFFTFFFRIVNTPGSVLVFFIFAIALVRRTWVPATGTCKEHFLTLQARGDDPTRGSRFDKEVMLRAFQLVHLQRNYNY